MPITGYLVSGAPDIVATTTDASKLGVVFQGLSEEVHYEFEVLAVNGAGNSESASLKVAVLGNEIIVDPENVPLPESSLVLGLGLPSVGDQVLSGAFRLVLVLGSSFIVASTLMLVFDNSRQTCTYKSPDIRDVLLKRKIIDGCRNCLANGFRLGSHK